MEVAPFVVRVAAAAPKPKAQPLSAGAIPIRITATGFEPARVQIPQGKAVTLAFLRTGEPNCGGRIVFPSLNISRDVALGGVTLINLPAQSKTELFFTCGMGMYRGSLVIVAP